MKFSECARNAKYEIGFLTEPRMVRLHTFCNGSQRRKLDSVRHALPIREVVIRANDVLGGAIMMLST